MDSKLFFFINGHHTLFVDQFMYLVSLKAVWIPLYVSLLWVVWRNYSWKGTLAVLLMVGAGMLITDWGNAHILRPWIGRLRPSDPGNPISSMVHIVNGRRGAGCGFPSAHAANIWLLTLLMMHWFRDSVLSRTMLFVSLLVCYSRVYLGYHYPFDILSGIVLAWLVVWLLTWLQSCYRRFKPKKTPCHTWIAAVTAMLTVGTFVVLAYLKTV